MVMVVFGDVNAFGIKNSDTLLKLKNLISVEGNINIAETGLNHFPSPNIEHIGGNIIISKNSSENLCNEIQKLKDKGVLKGDILFWESPDKSLKEKEIIKLCIGGISISNREDPTILLASIPDMNQEEFEISLHNLLQWMSILRVKEIVFQNESNLVLPDWFIQQFGQLKLPVQGEHRSMYLICDITPQGIKFLNWLQAKKGEIDLLGNVPIKQIKSLAEEFCEAYKYENSSDFSREVASWLDGKGSLNIIKKLIDISCQIKTKNQTYNSKVSPFKRYSTIQYHAIFLFLCIDNFPSFIDKYWLDLNTLTGDYLDIYYSHEDIKRSASNDGLTSFINGRAVSEQLNICLRNVGLPALFLWQDSLNDGFVVSLYNEMIDQNMTDLQILKLFELIVQDIKDNKGFLQICETAKGFVQSKTNSPKATTVKNWYNFGGQIQTIDTVRNMEAKAITKGDTYNQTGNIGIGHMSNGEIKDGAKVAGVINEVEQQNLAEAAAEIQALFEQLSNTCPADTTLGKISLATKVVEYIEGNPPLMKRILSALKAGGVSALEQALDHPAASFIMGALKDWQGQ